MAILEGADDVAARIADDESRRGERKSPADERVTTVTRRIRWWSLLARMDDTAVLLPQYR